MMSLFCASSGTKPVFPLFLAFTNLHMLWVSAAFFTTGTASTTPLGWCFHLSAWLVYSVVYAAVGLLPAWLFARLYPQRVRVTSVLAVVCSVFALMFIQSDRMIYALYNFHFNGFIWNLITTKGGLASLGTSHQTYVSIACSVLMVVGLQMLAWWLSQRLGKPKLTAILRPVALAVVLVLFILQAVIYGLSDARNEGAILDTASVYPFYIKVTFRGLIERMGIQTIRPHNTRLRVDTSHLHYPLSPIHFNNIQQPPNIVILVAESLRWDRLTPETMPNVWALSQQGLHFNQHYSSGNGTREGLFGMFYGLYGSYWSSFLHAQQSPLLMDRVQSLGYQLDVRTSAKFSYPEFNKTLFAKVPVEQLHEADEHLAPWQRDEQNASEQIAFLRSRDKQKPFMSFFFFESTHARYDFPEQAVIASPYLKDVNYWGMRRESLKPHIAEFKNRYTNAAHWVDAQMGRVIDELKAQNLMDNTIIIITGDHGEEFLEKGFWGHNSSFVEEQTHTPFVMWLPGHGHAEIERTTSHLDVSPTLLQALEASSAVADYALGQSLLDETPRGYIVTSDWHSISILTARMKYRVPYQSHGVDHFVPTGAKDEPLVPQTQETLMTEYQSLILEAIQGCSRFLALNKGA